MTKPIRPIRVEGQLAYVPLTRGYEAVIDVEDMHLVGDWNWYAIPHDLTVYAARMVSVGGHRVPVRMHNVIVPPCSGVEQDHKDGNGLNNRRSNLRVATRQQNQCNRRTPKNNTSGHKGISWDKSAKKWRALMWVNGKRHHLGLFVEVGMAVNAYRSAIETHHKEFARFE